MELIQHDPSAPRSFTREEMLSLTKRWSKIYSRFKDDVEEFILEAGGEHVVEIKTKGTTFRDLFPSFQ